MSLGEPPGTQENLLDPGRISRTPGITPKPWKNLLVSEEMSWSLGDSSGSSVALLVPGKAQLLKGKQQKSPLCKVNSKHIPLKSSRAFFIIKYPIILKTAPLGSSLNSQFVRMAELPLCLQSCSTSLGGRSGEELGAAHWNKILVAQPKHGKELRAWGWL